MISFAALAPQHEKLAGELKDAVERIEWALREVLPGQRPDIENVEFPSQELHSKKRQRAKGRKDVNVE